MGEITEKQWSVIKDITYHLGYIFSGKTRKEASDFIGKYLPKLKKYWDDIYLAESFKCDAEGSLMNQ